MSVLLPIALLVAALVVVYALTTPARIAPAIHRMSVLEHRDDAEDDEARRRGAYIQEQRFIARSGAPRDIILSSAPACEVRFGLPLPVPIRIAPRRADTPPGPIRSGNPRFDGLFAVHSPLPELAEQLLTPSFCRALLGRAHSRGLSLDERGARLRLAPNLRPVQGLPRAAEWLTDLVWALEAALYPRERVLEQLARTRSRLQSLPTDLSFLPEPSAEPPTHLTRRAADADLDLHAPLTAQLSHTLADGSLRLHLELRQPSDTPGAWRRLRVHAPIHTLSAAVLTLPELAQADAEALEEHELIAILAWCRGRDLFSDSRAPHAAAHHP